MYSDIYKYLHPRAISFVERKRKCQAKERSERAEARAMTDEQAVKKKRRTNWQLLMAESKQNKKNRENQRGKLRSRKCKNQKQASPNKKPVSTSNSQQRSTKVEDRIQAKKDAAKEAIKKFLELKLTLKEHYELVEKFAYDENAQTEIVPLPTEIDKMLVIQLAHLKCREIQNLLYQIAVLYTFSSSHIEALTEHLAELNKIDVKKSLVVGPQLPGVSKSIGRLEKNWNAYSGLLSHGRGIPSQSTIQTWVKHLVKEKTIKISNWNYNRKPSWLALQ